MKKLLVLLLLPILIAQCKSKKTKLADEDVVEIESFIEFFPDISLPFQVSDTLLNRKETDSSTIGYKIFTQFIPDSVISQNFGKNIKPKIYPIGKSVMKNNETYLFAKAVTATKKIGYILAFDNDNKFLSAMPLVIVDKDPLTRQLAGMDKKRSITVLRQKRANDGSAVESKNVYVLNADARQFTLILTDEGMQAVNEEVINPIDTLAKKSKYAADYIKDARNFISVRDGKHPTEVIFFAHFEKLNGECRGEIKGTATINGTRTAVYRANGNPCVLEFTFNPNSIAMKEVEACGSYRDIKCFFDGTYPRKKEAKPKKTKPKRTK